MSDLNLTIAAGFADGPSNTMEPVHWTKPIGEIEEFLQGAVGRDGVGGDNISADQAIHGVNFRSSGLTEVWAVDETETSWTVSAETSLFTSTTQAVTNSELPGGTLRFCPRGNGTAFVFYVGRAIATGALSQAFYFGYSEDGAPVNILNELNAASLPSTGADQGISMAWSTSVAAGTWKTIKHHVVENGDSTQVVFGETHMMVVAVYQ